MNEYVINSSHPNNECPTPIADGVALVIFWSPTVALSNFRTISLHVHFRNWPKFALKVFLNPLTSEASIINYSDDTYDTFPWSDRHPIVIIKHDIVYDCTILASDSKKPVNSSIRAIPKYIGPWSLKFQSVSIYTQFGVYGDAKENFKATGPFTITVFGGLGAAAEAKLHAKELHAERLDKNRLSEKPAASNDHQTELKEREMVVSRYRDSLVELDERLKARENIVLAKETVLGDRETSLNDREQRVSNREVDVVDRERIVADRERRVAQREYSISERTQEANLGQGQPDGSD